MHPHLIVTKIAFNLNTAIKSILSPFFNLKTYINTKKREMNCPFFHFQCWEVH